MSNLYIYAGQIAHTHAELAVIKNSTVGSVRVFVFRWAKKMKAGWGDPPWFQRLKIDDYTTDDMVQKICTETFDFYVIQCRMVGQENEFDPPQGKVEWEPPSKVTPSKETMNIGGGCLHRLIKEEGRGTAKYYQTHDRKEEPGPWIIYQSHDPERVNRQHRRRCHEENLWHPWRENIYYVIDGVRYPNKTQAAKAAGVVYHTFCKKVDKCHTLEDRWPDGWEEKWD